MSGYGGRRAPNFAQYLEDLNTIPSPYDQSLQQQQNDTFNIDAELELFTNTEFLDFGHFGDMSMPLAYNPAEDDKLDGQKQDKQGDMNYMDLLGDLNNIPEYSADFNTLANNHHDNHNHNNMPMTTTFPVIPRIDDSSFKNHTLEKHTPARSGASSIASTPAAAGTTGTKRKQSHDSKNLDEAARAAAEEDKRRRNTAASARFRIKKKQREQALELSVKEANEKNNALEARVSELELENKWLKNLITEKNGGEDSAQGSKSENDIAQMFKKFLATQKGDGERKTNNSKIGVGTP